MDETIRVVLADDHPVVRQGIRAMLEAVPDIRVVGEANNGAEALDLVAELTPDVLLLDVSMPKLTGLEVAKQLAVGGGTTHILVLSAHDEEQYISNVIGHGAAGYLLKDEAPEQIIAAVRGVAVGETGWFSKRVTTTMLRLQAASQKQAEPDSIEALTQRELEVLHLLAQGLDNTSIAEALTVSKETIKYHLRNIYAKFGVANRTEALVYAMQAGLVSP